MDFSKESIFTGARSHKKFDGQPLTTDQLRSIYELAKYAPTANNSCPLRIIFVNTSDSMARLAECAMDFNQERTRSAGSAAILAYDIAFYEQFTTLAPHMKQPPSHAEWNEERLTRFALANSNMQAGFFIAAARALSFDCGPMGGFHSAEVEADFFDSPTWKFNCVILLGNGDAKALRPRAARLSFDEACRIR